LKGKSRKKTRQRYLVISCGKKSLTSKKKESVCIFNGRALFRQKAGHGKR